jgi:hypothetical protein
MEVIKPAQVANLGQRETPVVVHSFPQEFQSDESFLQQALTEWNREHRAKYGYSELHFDALRLDESQTVLMRAQELKRRSRRERGAR